MIAYMVLCDDNKYWHEGEAVSFCQLYHGRKFPIHKVEILESETGGYWGWWDTERQEYQNIYPRKHLVEMCFPYGTDVEEARGRGRLAQLSVEFIEDCPLGGN